MVRRVSFGLTHHIQGIAQGFKHLRRNWLGQGIIEPGLFGTPEVACCDLPLALSVARVRAAYQAGKASRLNLLQSFALREPNKAWRGQRKLSSLRGLLIGTRAGSRAPSYPRYAVYLFPLLSTPAEAMANRAHALSTNTRRGDFPTDAGQFGRVRPPDAAP
jgi:hypothetical protein